MQRIFSRIALLLLLLGAEQAAFACPNYDSESHVTRTHPVKSVPKGAIQMMVDVPYDEEKMRSLGRGTITIPVMKVLNGQFDKETVTVSFDNPSSCDYFGPTGKGRYLVIYPLYYAEGDPVLDEIGNPELHVIRYNHNIDPMYLGILEDYGPDSFDPRTPEVYSCIRRGGAKSQAFDACADSDEPHNLYRQSYDRYYALAFVGCACLIAGLFILRGLRTQ